MPGHGHRSRPNPLCVQEAIANEDKALEDLVSVANVVSRLNLYSLLYTSSVWCWCGKTTGLSYVPIFLGIVTAHNVLSIWGVWQNVEGYLLAWATLRLLPSGNWSTRVWRRLKPSQLQRRNFWNWGWSDGGSVKGKTRVSPSSPTSSLPSSASQMAKDDAALWLKFNT